MKDLQKEDKEIYELMLRSNGPAPDIEEISKDKVLDNFYERMGYAKYQIIQILLISFLNIAIGAESLFLNVIEIQLLEEWKLQMYEAALLISSFSFGIAVG